LYSACVPIPEPRDGLAVTDGKRAMMVADSYHTDAIPPFLEFQGWMERVPLPERAFRARVARRVGSAPWAASYDMKEATSVAMSTSP
jgi:hypothetical protein